MASGCKQRHSSELGVDMPNAIQEDIICQRCVDRDQECVVYLMLEHYDDTTDTTTLMLSCSNGHSWEEISDG